MAYLCALCVPSMHTRTSLQTIYLSLRRSLYKWRSGTGWKGRQIGVLRSAAMLLAHESHLRSKRKNYYRNGAKKTSLTHKVMMIAHDGSNNTHTKNIKKEKHRNSIFVAQLKDIWCDVCAAERVKTEDGNEIMMKTIFFSSSSSRSLSVVTFFLMNCSAVVRAH